MGKIKFPALEMRSVFKDYDFHCVQGLERETIGPVHLVCGRIFNN